MLHKTALEAKVVAVNGANAHAMKIYPQLRDIFEPLVGCQIDKKDGGFLQSVAKLMPEFPYTTALHVYRSHSDYSLMWVVKTCEMYRSSRNDCQLATYYEASVYVGHMRNRVLEKFFDPPTLQSSYTVGDVLKAREKYREAKRIADEARSALDPFGEND
jgi:hypothetical protein